MRTGDSLAASMAVPVRYNNRNSKDTGIALIACPGGYYLAASLEDGSTVDIGSELAFNLAIDVSGDAGDGPLLNATAAAAAPSKEPSEQSPAAAAADAPQEAPTSGGAGPLWWGLGLAGLLAAAAGAFVFLRRRSTQRSIV